MSLMVVLEALSYVVTIIGLPFAIAVFVHEQRKHRQNEENALHRLLSEEYDRFLSVLLGHSDLLLLRQPPPDLHLTEEQVERKYVLLTILVSLFEKAYIIVHSQHMSEDTQRLWRSWEDYMREWCRREDFRTLLPRLLEGEDAQFSEHIRRIAAAEKEAAAGR
jgi:hypothetical protein